MLQEIAIQKVRDFLVFKLVEFSSNSIVFCVCFCNFFMFERKHSEINSITSRSAFFFCRKRRGKIEPGWNFRQPEMTGRFLKTKVLNHLIPSPDHMWKPPGGIKGADRGLGKGWKLEGATNRT